MDTKINWPVVLLLASLFTITSSVAQAHQPILVTADSGGQVPIEGTWVFEEGCYVNDDPEEYEFGKDTQEFLIFTGDQVEGRLVQYDSENGDCDGNEIFRESDTGTVFFGGIQDEGTCWDGPTPQRQDSAGPLAENPVATWLIYWLGEGETETGLFYIDDTGETWYLWRYTTDGDNGNGENGNGENGNGGEPEPPCPFPLSHDEPLIKVSPATITVTIDIKPGSDPNSVNPRSKGVIPVAVLGSMDFDTTQIDVSTVFFGPAKASPVHDGHIEDVDADGFMDMVLHFDTQETGIACGDTEATLNGDTHGGGPFTGTDSVNTVGCK
jgi:hypothetical protein